jgi:hypothetical protein
MPEEDYDKDFPNLKSTGYARTSEPEDYNCIAFAVGDKKKWWWPSGSEDEYWPLPIPDEISQQSFAEAFATAGFVPCENGDPDAGSYKIALYGFGIKDIQHAARLEAGANKWKSKLGAHEDIEHTLEGLEGPCYGKVLAYFRRPAHTLSEQTN